MKDKKQLIIISLSVVVFDLVLSAYILGTKNSRRIAVNFETSVPAEEEHKYQFLQKSMSDYICSLSEELKIDSDLVVAILMAENPEFNPEAVHRNINGTIDCGLFQLNDRYIWTSFANAYWFDNVELDPFNWKHNSFLAIHHLAYLQSKLKVTDEIIMAYNCGINAVMADKIPDSTKSYLRKVKTNLFLLNQQVE